VGQKRLQLLGDAVPQASVIAVLANPDVTGVGQTNDLKAAASRLTRSVRMLPARTTAEIDAAFATITQERIRALLISSDSLFINRLDQIVALATRHSVPAIFELREFAAAGGLMSYGPSYRDNFRQLGVYAGRILKGEKPADLPVMLPTKFELAINLKTARALGLTIPETLLATADEVIQ
jgi:putative ABC transport system substrate-binding protein